MAVTGKKVLRFTADGDTFDSGLKGLEIKGCRLVTVAADAVAKVRMVDSNGEILYSLSAAAKDTDDTAIETYAEGGTVYVSLTGAGAEVYLYLE